MPATITTNTDAAAQALTEGKLVGLPTETVYGLGGNALDPVAVAGIFKAKERPSFDPLIIHQSSPQRIFHYAREVPEAAEKLAAACWPGPLTLVLPKTTKVPDLVSAGLHTVALRVPAHPLTRAVLAAIDFPVAAPSANPFGFVSPTTAQHVADQLGDKIDLILDGGPCKVGLESTIVGFPEGKPTVLRKGGLPIEQLTRILGSPPDVKTHSSSRPDAPGMLSKHYSPGVPMVLLDWDQKPDAPGKIRAAWITFGNNRPSHELTQIKRYNLSPQGDLTQAAANLFATLRVIAAGGYDKVYADKVPDTGLGKAINDRLRRAAAKE